MSLTEKTIQNEIDQLKKIETQVDTATHEDCKQTLKILIPESIKILEMVKKLVHKVKGKV